MSTPADDAVPASPPPDDSKPPPDESKRKRKKVNFALPPGLELDRIISLQEAESVSGLSRDSWKRHHADKVIELSPQRLGVRLKHALMLHKDQPKRSTRG